MRKALLVCVALWATLCLVGCSGGSLTMQDVDATFARLSDQVGATPDWEAGLIGSVITEDFVWEDEGAPSPETDEYRWYVSWQLPLLPVLLRVAQEDENASVKIEGDTLVMKGDRNRLRVEFVQSGGIFLISRVTD